jgi:hypothetical protein
MFMSHGQSAGQNHNLKTNNKSSKTVTNFEYLARTQKKSNLHA